MYYIVYTIYSPSLVDSSESIGDVDTDIDTDNTDTDNDHEDNVPLALNIVTLDIVFAFLLLSEVENNATRPWARAMCIAWAWL